MTELEVELETAAELEEQETTDALCAHANVGQRVYVVVFEIQLKHIPQDGGLGQVPCLGGSWGWWGRS